MAPEGFKRKLTSIFSADAVGYSRLMGDDEAATVRTLTSYRNVISTLIKQHNGTVIDSPGDNLLAEFVSVVDAVQCAVAVQKEIKTRNDDLPESRRMQFRIGINLGDVIQEDDRIYGDGVNIAARLEALAEPGGICISKTAFDHIESKLPYGYEFLGDQPVKNISKPVGAYRVLMEPRVTFAVKPEKEKRSPVRRMPIIFGAAAIIALAFAVGIWQLYVRRPAVEPASADKMAYPLPDKPSIAVLPFDNLSGDPNQEYIADGISENIIATLSNVPELFVIARNSTFTYKGKAVKVQQIAEDLGVRYVLEGSVQKSMDSIRVTVQLIDAIAGHHLWSEKFDRKMESLFQIMDEITHKVVIELQVQLVEGEPARKRYGTNKIDAWAYLVKGFTLFETYQKTNNERARELFEQALKIDPEYAYAWVMLSWTYYIEVRQGYSRFPPESIKQSIQFAQRAKAIDDTLSDIYALLGSIYLIQRQHDKAIAEGQKSIQLGPNNASNHILLAQIMFYAGKTKEAVALAEKAIRLNPYCPNWYFGILILCYRQAERYEEAIDIAEALLDQGQKDGGNLLLPHLQLAAIYSMMGQYEKARKHWEEVLLINPNFTSEYLRKTAFFKDPAKVEHVLEALRKAGLK